MDDFNKTTDKLGERKTMICTQLALIVVQKCKPGDNADAVAKQVLNDYNRAYDFLFHQQIRF